LHNCVSVDSRITITNIGNEVIGPSERGLGPVPEMPERKQEKASSKYPPIETSGFAF
jgi:hypothetical protein